MFLSFHLSTSFIFHLVYHELFNPFPFTVFCSGLCISLCRYHSICFQSNINVVHEHIFNIWRLWRLVACIASTTKPPVLDKVQSSFGRRQCQVLEGQPLQVLLVHDYWLLVMTMGTDEPSTFLTKLHPLFQISLCQTGIEGCERCKRKNMTVHNPRIMKQHTKDILFISRPTLKFNHNKIQPQPATLYNLLIIIP